MRCSFVAALSVALALSCGGKTGTVVGNTSAGGDTGDGSSGGTAGNGAATGVGGSGATGAAGSGSAAGTSGSGGVNPNNSIAEKITDVCAALASTQCSVSLCLGELLLHNKDAANYGCETELASWLDCAVSHPLLCTPYAEEHIVETNPACAAQDQALEACLPTCSGFGTGNNVCKMSCTGKVSWAVQCEPSELEGHLHCVCTEGPMKGMEAELGVTCSGVDMGALAEDLCL